MKYLLSLVLVTLAVNNTFAQTVSGPFQTISSNITNSVQSQEDEVDWKTEFEKLEFRLRELEDDFVSQSEGLEKSETDQDNFSQGMSEELRELSETVDSLSESVGKVEETLPRLVYNRHSGPTMNLFGRIHTSYFAFADIDPGIAPLFGGNPQDSFGLRRLRIGIQGDINDNMFYQIETEFANANNFQFRDAYLGFRKLPLLNTVIIGNHKRPYSLDQLNSSNNNVFLDRPFVADAFNDSNRRFGISSSGVSEDLRYNWRSGIWNMENIQNDGMFAGDDYQLELASRFAATPWWDERSNGRGYLHVAIASANRFPDGDSPNNQSEYSTIAEAITPNILFTGPIAGADSESLYGFEAVLNIGAFQCGAEYMETFVDRGPVDPNLNFHGGYIYAAYMLTGEHMPWNRRLGQVGGVKPFENFFAVRDCNCNVARGWGAWQIAARYSYLDLNDEDIIGGQADSLTLGLNWWWNKHARMQFNYVNGDIDRAPADGKFDLFGMQFEIYF